MLVCYVLHPAAQMLVNKTEKQYILYGKTDC